MKLCKMIEMYFKYNNMYTIGSINAFVCINNHLNSCIQFMLSTTLRGGVVVVVKVTGDTKE